VEKVITIKMVMPLKIHVVEDKMIYQITCGTILVVTDKIEMNIVLGDVLSLNSFK
jgi:hypothetical protein